MDAQGKRGSAGGVEGGGTSMETILNKLLSSMSGNDAAYQPEDYCGGRHG